MKIQIKWKEIVSEGRPCMLCDDDCSFRCVIEYQPPGKPARATCSLGMGVGTMVVEGLKPTANCPGPGEYIKAPGGGEEGG